MAVVVSRTVFRGVNWQKQAGLLQQMMYFQSGNIALDVFTHWLEGESIFSHKRNGISPLNRQTFVG